MTALTAHGTPGHPRRPLPAWWHRAAPRIAGVLAVAGLGYAGFWLAERPLVRGHGRDYQAGPQAGPGATGASVLGAAGIPAGSRISGLPGDTTHPAGFAVYVGHANTPAGAILRLQQIGTAVPAGTYAPISGRAAGGYRIVAGAFPTSNAAETVLQNLRAHGQISETSGTVVRVPLAYMIERDVAADAAAARVAAFAARGLPVYALRQADGRVWLYAGAFASAADTGSLGDALRQAGLRPTLAYRTGRPF